MMGGIIDIQPYYITYILSSDLGTMLTQIQQQAWLECPQGCQQPRLLLGDLNANLPNPQDEWEDAIAEQVHAMDLVEMSGHFCQRRQRQC